MSGPIIKLVAVGECSRTCWEQAGDRQCHVTPLVGSHGVLGTVTSCPGEDLPMAGAGGAAACPKWSLLFNPHHLVADALKHESLYSLSPRFLYILVSLYVLVIYLEV